ncbi:MAG TPA: thioredoxin-like domain-containing protein, partial [Bacteroidia bacterium]|nr:thioredoxin-like domain-containing protein [Bacteroidia bacterium]
MIRGLLKIFVVLNVLFAFKLSAQTPNTVLKQGDPTPALILYNNQNTQQSISFPYINKVVLLHFWSSSVSRSKPFIPRLLDIHERYSNAVYRNADGFEAFTIAVQSDKTAWNEDIVNMKMEGVSNLIAPRGYNDLTIRNFKITQLPLTLLISETGQVLMVNPTQLEIEDVLDGKKNSPVNTKDLKARILFSETPTDAVKNHKMVLKNKFGDTLSRTTSDNSGVFTFYGVKFLKDYIIKLDTSGSLQNVSKAYLSTSAGAVFGTINKTDVGFELPLTLNEINKMNASDKETIAQKNALTVNPNVTFKAGTAQIDEG